jgi:hypothetical protein
MWRSSGLVLTLCLACSESTAADPAAEGNITDPSGAEHTGVNSASETDGAETCSSATPSVSTPNLTPAADCAPIPNMTNPESSTSVTVNATSSANPNSAQGGAAGNGNSVSGGAAGNGNTANGAGAAGESARGGAAAGGSSSGGSSAGGAGVGGTDAVNEGVTLDGSVLLVNGSPFHIQGVAWNPVDRGQTHPAGLDYAGFAATDIPLMQAAGINAVRTYEPLLDRAVLDQLFIAGIYVLNSIYPYGGDDVNVVTERVDQVKDHPAILLWLLGNEWNYNGLYVDLAQDVALARLNEAAALVRAADVNHPLATVYGELPSSEIVAAMPLIDLWGINAYRGISFGALFDDWAARSDKAMFLAEYGADAYNANSAQYDPMSQAEAVSALTLELATNGSAFGAGPCAGGTLFEWADEWWKDASGSPDAQEVGGIAPGGGPYPDSTFNEEWWGVVDIDRNPRPAYDALRDVFAP